MLSLQTQLLNQQQSIITLTEQTNKKRINKQTNKLPNATNNVGLSLQTQLFNQQQQQTTMVKQEL